MEKDELDATHGASVPATTCRGKPAARRERALALYCEGRRTSEIATVLGVSASTVRRWLKASLEGLADDARARHAEQLVRAIESQRAIASAAWEAYRNEREVERALLHGELDRVRRRTVRATRAHRGCDANAASELRPAEADEGVLVEEYERPRHTSQGARYLGVALAAQREVARLQGLYESIRQEPPALHITLSRPEDTENQPSRATIAEMPDESDGTDV
jgi:hypothetical protein